METPAGAVTSTAEHPFYVVGKGWVPVRDLQLGDRLVDPKGSDVDVVAVAATGETATVYNFNVDELHTYHVEAGETWVRVHNSCTPAEEALATQHVSNSGDTVLGHFPAYINKAQARGASYFDVGDRWDEIAAVKDPWELNEHFLRDRVAAGDRMLLSLPRSEIRPGSYLEKDISFLQDHGYKFVNQWALRPGS